MFPAYISCIHFLHVCKRTMKEAGSSALQPAGVAALCAPQHMVSGGPPVCPPTLCAHATASCCTLLPDSCASPCNLPAAAHYALPCPSPTQAQAKRQAIRRTWMQLAKDRYPDVVIRFILAQVGTGQYILAWAGTGWFILALAPAGTGRAILAQVDTGLVAAASVLSALMHACHWPVLIARCCST